MSSDTFLVDTNILSNGQKKSPDHQLTNWLAQQKRIAIPYPVIVEIEQGIGHLYPRNPVRAQLLRSWFDGLLDTQFLFPEMTPAVARLQAALYSCRPLKHLWFVGHDSEKRPGNDLAIAAVAIAHHLPIATCDTWDFGKIATFFPLPGVYNPVTDEWVVKQSMEHRPMSNASMASGLATVRSRAS